MDSQKPYVHPPFPQFSEQEEETPPHGHLLDPSGGLAGAPARAASAVVAPQMRSQSPAHAAYAPTPPHGSASIPAHTPWPPVPVAPSPTDFAAASTSGTFEARGIPAPAHMTGSFGAVGPANAAAPLGAAPGNTDSFGAAPGITGSFGAVPGPVTGNFQAPAHISGAFQAPAHMTGAFPAQGAMASKPAVDPRTKRMSYGIWGGLAGGLVGASLGVLNAILEGAEIARAQDPLIIITLASMFFSGGLCAAYPAALQTQLKRAGITFGEDG